MYVVLVAAAVYVIMYVHITHKQQLFLSFRLGANLLDDSMQTTCPTVFGTAVAVIVVAWLPVLAYFWIVICWKLHSRRLNLGFGSI